MRGRLLRSGDGAGGTAGGGAGGGAVAVMGANIEGEPGEAGVTQCGMTAACRCGSEVF